MEAKDLEPAEVLAREEVFKMDSVIKLRDIKKSFYIGKPNELEILHGISLSVQKGEFVSIVGASGSGKSTLMNVIGLLDRPTDGCYEIEGRDVAGASDQELSLIRNRKIGFVFQTYNLIARTDALKNVELPMMYAGVSKKVRAKRAAAIRSCCAIRENVTIMRSCRMSGILSLR